MSDRAPLVGDTWCTDPADPTREVRYSHGHVIEVRPISDVQPYTREELDALDDRFDATGEMDELRALAAARDTYRLSGTTKFTNVKKTLEIIDRLRATARAAVERGVRETPRANQSELDAWRKRAEEAEAVECELPVATVQCLRDFANHMETEVIPQIVTSIRERQAAAAECRRASIPLTGESDTALAMLDPKDGAENG